jgi:Sulfotransferase family
VSRPPDYFVPTPAQVRRGLSAVGSGPETADHEKPVFVLGCGWRSGSTLLQRMIMTDERVVVWGEPLGRLAPLTRLTDLVAHAADSPPPAQFSDLDRLNVPDPTADWIANLFPGGQHLRAGLRAFSDGWLAAPARDRGYARWGVKEVRLSSADALVLRWLYPRAHLVVLVRDPFDSWRSLRAVAQKWGIFERYPDRPMSDAAAFGRLWNRLAMSWSDPQGPSNVGHLRYEDLVRGELGDLEARLELDLDPARALDARVGGSAAEAPTDEELVAIESTTTTGRRTWGYTGVPAWA